MDRNSFCENLPEKIRVSLGSAVVLGLADAKLGVAPTTAHMMTFRQGKCTANCGFCAQARDSLGRSDTLSRVTWPCYRTSKVLKAIEKSAISGSIKRVCIQALNYPEVFLDLIAILKKICRSPRVPISVSCQPLNFENMRLLAAAGAERIGIPLDAANEEVFDRTKGAFAKGPYKWKRQWRLLNAAKQIFGKDKVSTHLIVGLGETEEDMIKTIQKCVDKGILPALFSFTPLRGTTLENKGPPSIETYRRIQIARHLILHKMARAEEMRFGNGILIEFGITEEKLKKVVQTDEPFLTSGCDGCNRPYYNERLSGPVYNYPRKLTPTELNAIKKQLTTKCP